MCMCISICKHIHVYTTDNNNICIFYVSNLAGWRGTGKQVLCFYSWGCKLKRLQQWFLIFAVYSITQWMFKKCCFSATTLGEISVVFKASQVTPCAAEPANRKPGLVILSSGCTLEPPGELSKLTSGYALPARESDSVTQGGAWTWSFFWKSCSWFQCTVQFENQQPQEHR